MGQEHGFFGLPLPPNARMMPDNPKTDMRPILFLLLAGTLIANAQNPTPAQQAEQFYTKGVALEKAGNVTAAKAAYLQALQLNPRHADAQYRVGELKQHGGNIAAKARQNKFGNIVIPQMNLEDASVAEALEALRLSMDKASNGAEVPNFVLKDPDRKLEKTTISFQLKSVPAKGILEYILSQSRAKATYDEYAVVIEPRP